MFATSPQAQYEYSAQVIHSRYFPHIDGLRTLAVLPVVIYHLLSYFCPGGYAGVDVFFVISGYLITGGIIRDLQKGDFTIASFYNRRIKRILPAYSFLLLAVLVFTSAFTTQEYVKNVGYTAFYSTFFSSNLFFFQNSGYFSPNAKGNPLLNLWSLSVEEQFYIIIPLLLIFIWKIKKERWLIYILSSLVLFSLAGSIYGMAKGHQVFVFYMLPTRAWELLAGAVVAMAPEVKMQRAAPALGLLGTACLFYPYIFYTSQTAFPGFAALPSVLGSCLVIRYGSVGWVGRVLTLPAFVGIGKISYSLYLWHWPIIVCWTYATFGRKQPADYLGMTVLSFALAYVSWRWVEMPVRRNQHWQPKHSFQFAATALVCLACYSFLVYGTKRLEQHLGFTITRSNFYTMTRTDKICRQRHIRELVAADLEKCDPNAVRLLGKKDGAPSFVVWGNSHAGGFFSAMDSLATDAGKTGYFVNFLASPVLNVYVPLRCDFTSWEHFQRPEQTAAILDWIVKNREIQEVYLIARWPKVYPKNAFASGKGTPAPVTPEENRRLFQEGLKETCQQLHDSGKRVVIFTSVAEPKFFVHETKEKERIFPWAKAHPTDIPATAYENDNAEVNSVLKDLAARGLATVIPVHKAFLRGDHYITMDAKKVYYSDDNHLSLEGIDVARQYLAPLLWK